jgi:hypothetical protein
MKRVFTNVTSSAFKESDNLRTMEDISSSQEQQQKELPLPTTQPISVLESPAITPPIQLPNPLQCPKCHQQAPLHAYFCPNCGENLRPVPAKTDLSSQIGLYTKSVLLPPLGIVWGLRYLKNERWQSRLIGLTAIVITVVVIVVGVKLTIELINNINEQVNSQLQNIQMY